MWEGGEIHRKRGHEARGEIRGRGENTLRGEIRRGRPRDRSVSTPRARLARGVTGWHHGIQLPRGDQMSDDATNNSGGPGALHATTPTVHGNSRPPQGVFYPVQARGIQLAKPRGVRGDRGGEGQGMVRDEPPDHARFLGQGAVPQGTRDRGTPQEGGEASLEEGVAV